MVAYSNKQRSKPSLVNIRQYKGEPIMTFFKDLKTANVISEYKYIRILEYQKISIASSRLKGAAQLASKLLFSWPLALGHKEVVIGIAAGELV